MNARIAASHFSLQSWRDSQLVLPIAQCGNRDSGKLAEWPSTPPSADRLLLAFVTVFAALSLGVTLYALTRDEILISRCLHDLRVAEGVVG